MKHFKMGLIGLGARGSSLYKLAIAERDYVEIVGVCDRYEDRVADVAKSVRDYQDSEPLMTQDYHDILDIPGIDCVLVATDWNQHLNVSQDALKRA